MNKKNIMVNVFNVILFIITCILMHTYKQSLDLEFDILPKIMFIVPILFIILYFIVSIKKEKFYDTNKISNVVIANNLSLIIIFFVDLLYSKYILYNIWGISYPSFMLAACFFYDILYVILIVWLLTLKKNKIKK